MEYKTLESLVNRKIGYGIVQPGQSVSDGVPIIKVNNLIAGLHSKNELDVTTKENDEKYSRTRLEGGELIVSVVGTVGKTAIVPKKFQGCNLVRAVAMIDIRENWLAKWVKYYIDSPAGQAYIGQNLNTTVQATLNIKTLVDMPIPFLKENEMRKIVAILEAIDKKIECNQEINDNLEQQLHQLFIQTFNGCDTNISLGKVVKTTSGGTPARKHREYYSNGTINWVKSKELTGQYLFDTEESLTSLGVAMSSAKILPAHSVLIAMYGATVGEHGITTKEMACNQAICALLENKDYPYTYLFQIAKENQQNLVNLAIGSAQQNISQILLKQLSVHSDVATIHQYHCLALPLHKEIELLQSENRLLNTTRDALLPELMTGELDLSSVDF